jgi:hypothetical protein
MKTKPRQSYQEPYTLRMCIILEKKTWKHACSPQHPLPKGGNLKILKSSHVFSLFSLIVLSNISHI